MKCINSLNKVYADLRFRLEGNTPIRNDVAGGQGVGKVGLGGWLGE